MYDTAKIDWIKKWLGSGSINIFGRPFSGKDAQGSRLADTFDGNLVGSGDILRSSYAEKQTRTGILTPTKDFMSIVLPYLKRDEFQGKPLILSSVGRWHGEEDGVVQTVGESGHPLKAVIYLDLSDEESRKRWQAREINNDRNGRHDDTEEVLEIRLKEFKEKTMPVVDYYNKSGRLITVDGQQTRDEVADDIIAALYKMACSER